MYSIRDSADLRKMKRIGILTVNDRNLYNDVKRYFFKQGMTPTEFFYKKLEHSTYHAGSSPILSTIEDGNTIVANMDNDAIFLYSENNILSPTQFVNLFAKLSYASHNVSRELQDSIYADFGLGNLKINFVNMNLMTGMTPEVMEQSGIKLERIGDSEHFYSSELDGIKELYDASTGNLAYSYSSQGGMDVVGFLDRIIDLDPDIRLLMSNTVLTPSEVSLKNVLTNAIRGKYHLYRDYTDAEIAELIKRQIESGKPIPEEEKNSFFEAFAEEQRRARYRLVESNKSYKVFPALRYVVGLQSKEDENEDLDSKYILEWYEGDPDNGPVAINYALAMIERINATEREDGMRASRNLPQVKDYMEAVKSRAIKASQKFRNRTEKIQNK